MRIKNSSFFFFFWYNTGGSLQCRFYNAYCPARAINGYIGYVLAGTLPPHPLHVRMYGTYIQVSVLFGRNGVSIFSLVDSRRIVHTRVLLSVFSAIKYRHACTQYGLYPRWVYIQQLLLFLFYVAQVPFRHKITYPLISQQAGVVAMPTGSHYQGPVLSYMGRAASAPNPCMYY